MYLTRLSPGANAIKDEEILRNGRYVYDVYQQVEGCMSVTSCFPEGLPLSSNTLYNLLTQIQPQRLKIQTKR